MAAGSTINPETFEAWAKIVIEIWKNRMMKYEVRNTGSLFISLAKHVEKHAGGDVQKIDFFYNQYGIYVDMGVGREFKQGNTGDVGREYGMTSPKRRAKPWYSTAFYAQVKRLTEIITEKYGKEAAQMIVGFYTDTVDSRVATRNQSSRARSARNYQRRRAQDGKWTKDGRWKIGFMLENHNYTAK